MSKVDVIRGKTIAVTGHRVMEKNFDIKGLEKLFLALIEKNFDTFLIGMAIGFDTLCFQILEEFRKQKNIKIIACIPCPTQAYKFNLEQKKEYDRMVSVADEKIILSDIYTPYCMQNRNKFMVDNSSCVISYLNKEKGGTYNTVKYANTQKVPVINVVK